MRLSLLPLAVATLSAGAHAAPFRPPSVPLVACDPYFSIWSNADRLTDDATRHWTGEPHRLTGLVRVDGKTFRVMGDEPKGIAPLPQTGVTVLPTRSIYRYAGAGVSLSLTFLTPALPEDVAVLSRPVTYLTWEVRSADGKPHNVDLYYDNGPEIVVAENNQAVRWSRGKVGTLSVLRMRSNRQPILARKGDRIRIDWGDLYVAAPAGAVQTIAAAALCRDTFGARGTLPGTYDRKMPRVVQDGAPVMATGFRLGRVGKAPVSRWLMLAYDDIYSIRLMSQNLRPYWRRNGMDAAGLLRVSQREYPSLKARCEAFDAKLMADLDRSGGPVYARLGALAYRECWAGNKIAADAKGQPLVFPKENSSNGCIATVDIIYPMAPQFLLFSPSLAKGMMVPILEYSASPRWKFPFAPHDMGTYPRATGQVYGGGELTEDNQMPVEETGNMLIVMTALAKMEGNTHFANRYWPVLAKWAAYLRDKGFDPENQLCTDDFAGHLAHNVNLSAKAIVALGAYAELCRMRGDKAAAASYGRTAREFAARWIKEGTEGDHTLLAFDRPGTWSQKYNLVWDRILGLKLFPESVYRKEMDFYKTVAKPYGVPLDNRREWAKLDWLVWTATLTGQRSDFVSTIAPIGRFLNDTPDRVPMSDWYWTGDARMAGFQARPVVGGVFLRLLDDPATWRRWAARDRTRSSGWAPLPQPERTLPFVATSEQKPVTWKYTTERPGAGWQRPDFNDASWQEGPGGFGTAGTPSAVVRTNWSTRQIWLRREFNLTQAPKRPVSLRIHHDEDAEVYINGVLAASLGSFTSSYDTEPMTKEAQRALRPGRNVIAVHCRQTTGGQYIDVGLVYPVK